MCSHIRQRATRLACCYAHRPFTPDAETAAAVAKAAEQRAAVQASLPRPDLDPLNPDQGVPLTWAPCNRFAHVALPVFALSGNATAVSIANFSVPLLSSAAIKAIKAAAAAALPQVFRDERNVVARVNRTSRFVHPGTCAGPSEVLVMMRQRIAGLLLPQQPQLAARDSLLFGTGVPPKLYAGPNNTAWSPPVDCPAGGAYGSSPDYYSMSNVRIKYGGINDAGIACPRSFPAAAPQQMCSHLSFVELDGQMSYKQALAWAVTGDAAYAATALGIIDRWASRNVEWGIRHENGPLEAGWDISAMAKALELLRSLKAAPPVISRFLAWANRLLVVPQMDWFTDVISAKAIAAGTPNVYSNWHATIGEAMMSVAILADDRARYNKSVQIFHSTVADYLRWGRGQPANSSRLLGECSETLRDLYHSQFGLGGLLQMAEIAWQQDEDLFSSSSHALAAAMETHARIINAWLAGKNAAMLPPGFRWFDGAMPKAPPGCRWAFNIKKQLWTAVNASSGAFVADLKDGLKYALGVSFLPTGWELGYLHFKGRLGLPMEQTAALLNAQWPDYYLMHWGANTLTHAGTAVHLWRAGVAGVNQCLFTVG